MEAALNIQNKKANSAMVVWITSIVYKVLLLKKDSVNFNGCKTKGNKEMMKFSFEKKKSRLKRLPAITIVATVNQCFQSAKQVSLLR